MNLRSSLVLALILLSGCPAQRIAPVQAPDGGGVAGAGVVVGVTVTGLVGHGLVLQLDDGGHNLPIPADGHYTFAALHAAGTSAVVTVQQQPTGPAQTCVVSGDASLTADAPADLTVTCVRNRYQVGGTVAGLAGHGLVLSNGDELLPVDAAGAFHFSQPLASGKSYSVAVAQQPDAPTQTCVVGGGSGVVGGAEVTSITVDCDTNHYTLGGTVTGLAGSTLTLHDAAAGDVVVSANGTFAFATPLSSGAPFAVSVTQQPATPAQTCVVTGASGTVSNEDVGTIAVACTVNHYTVGGTVSGLAGSGLVLQNNLGDDLPITANGAFVFATSVPSGVTYAVSVLSQPTSPSQTCTVSSASGTIGAAAVNSVTVSCTTNAYKVGGTVSGLAGAGLVLANGSDEISVDTDGNFQLPVAVDSGDSFDVTVETQPIAPWQTCTVVGGQGTIGAGNVGSVAVNCSTDEHLVGGTVSGLAGSGLTLQLGSGATVAVGADGGFAFAAPLASGTHYDVTVATQPTSPWQTCTVTSGSGNVAGTDVSDVQVSCTTNTYNVGGSVTGLAGSGLTLHNGTEDLPVSADGNFVFTTAVSSGQAYSVTVTHQPGTPAQTCTVTSGGGVVHGGNIGDVAVTCTTNRYHVGGSVSGLLATLVLANGSDALTLTADGDFSFGATVPSGGSYAVTVTTQPTSPSQTCTISSGSGSVTTADIGDITIRCVTDKFSVGGTVTGLAGGSLVLRNNGGDDLTVTGDGPFAFATTVASGQPFSVAVATQPSAPPQTCTVSAGDGNVGGAAVTSVSVNCTVDSYTVGGTVSGLVGSGLVLQNNLADDLTVPSDGAFAFATPVASGDNYAVTVQTQPSSPTQLCSVTRGSGTVGSAPVGDVAVTCVTQSYRVGVTVSGLAGSGLTLKDNGGDDLSVSANGTSWFTTPVLSGGNYAVTVLQQPTTPWQTCSVAAASGVMGGSDVDLTVTCTTNRYKVGGTVSGLTTSGLVLRNNAGDDLSVSGSGTFEFVTPVASGDAYAVTIQTQPSGQTCSVSAGSGNVAGGDVTTVRVMCQTLINGSFETGDYTGWTLWTSDANDASTTGIGVDGATLNSNDYMFDYTTHQSLQQYSFGLPITFAATDGTKVAVALQNGPVHRRIYQDVTIPNGASVLAWDMSYNNDMGSFDASAQYLAIYVRDPSTDAILATLYKTNDADDAQKLTSMTAFSASLATYAGQQVRIDVEVMAQYDYLDVVLDNFRLQ